MIWHSYILYYLFQFGFSYKSLKSIGNNKSPSLNPVGVGGGMTESVRELLSLGGAKTGTILEVVMQLQGTVMTTWQFMVLTLLMQEMKPPSFTTQGKPIEPENQQNHHENTYKHQHYD